MNHEQFQVLLDELAQEAGVGQEVLGEVLARISLRAPEETSRVEVSAGNPAARRPVDQRAIPQGTVSKAVKALKEKGLLEDGEKLLWGPDGGRPLAPLRLGSGYAIAGVSVVQWREEPRQVVTALLGLDGTRVLGITRSPAERWDQVAGLILEHLSSLKKGCDQSGRARGLKPLRIFGVGIEVGSPVYNGEVMPHARDASTPPIQLADELHRLLDTDGSFDQPVPVIVENDVNALAVLAIHKSTTPSRTWWWSVSSTRESVAAPGHGRPVAPRGQWAGHGNRASCRRLPARLGRTTTKPEQRQRHGVPRFRCALLLRAAWSRGYPCPAAPHTGNARRCRP